jgi:hypothetical protein
MVQKMTRAEYEEMYGISPYEPAQKIQNAVVQDNQQSASSQSIIPGIAKGVTKSGLDLFRGVGELGRGIQRAVTPKALEDSWMGTNSPFDKGSDANTNLREMATPQGGAEKFGKFAGDVATFAIPGGAGFRATKGAGALKTIGTQVASDTAVQVTKAGGEFDRETVDTAILAGVIPGGSAAVSAVKQNIGPSLGGRVINSLIKPLQKDFAYGKNPGEEVAKRGIKGNSLDELAQNIRTEKEIVGKQAANLFEESTEKFDVSTAFQSLDEALDAAKKAPLTNSNIINRLENLKSDLLQIGEGGVPTRKLSDLSALEVQQFKRDVGELTRWTGNASDDEITNKALTRVYGQLKGMLDEKVPGSRELNESYGNLISAETATKYRDVLAARQNLVSLPGVNVGVGGALVGAIASGGAITPALVLGVGAAGVQKAMSTPAGKTRMASWLAEMPNNERQSLLKEAPWLRAVMQEALFGEEDGVNSNTQ